MSKKYELMPTSDLGIFALAKDYECDNEFLEAVNRTKVNHTKELFPCGFMSRLTIDLKRFPIVYEELQTIIKEENIEKYSIIIMIEYGNIGVGICSNKYTYLLQEMPLQLAEFYVEDVLFDLEMEKHRTEKPKQKTYIIKDGSGLVKIGKSKNPTSRLKAIKCGNPNAFLYAICDDNVEKELHKKYSKYSVSKEEGKEWFSLSEGQIAEIISSYNFTIC